MRLVPAGATVTRAASFSTLRCCDTAGRDTGSPSASSPTDIGRSESVSTIRSRIGSDKARSAASALGMTYRKYRLTVQSRTIQLLALSISSDMVQDHPTERGCTHDRADGWCHRRGECRLRHGRGG